MDDEINISFEFYFDDDMKTFAIHLESGETMEVEELAEAIIDFGRKIRSGEVKLYNPEDEVVMH